MSEQEKCWYFVWAVVVFTLLGLTAVTGANGHPGWALLLLLATWVSIVELFKGPPAP